MEEKPYNSVEDAQYHIRNIMRVMEIIIDDLSKRRIMHDISKLQSPEKEGYDKFIPLLKKAKYGSPEYEQVRKDMYDEVLKHHFEANRHHPEHFENGVFDMTLVDIVEMFCDWYAASMNSDANFEEGLRINEDKFNFAPQLTQIFLNTYNEYMKPNEHWLKDMTLDEYKKNQEKML